MKIGTLSINTHTVFHNYGAILHSWAFQQYLLRTIPDVETEIIDYTTPNLENHNLKCPIISHWKNRNRRMFIKSLLLYPIYRKRYNKIEKFIASNMLMSKKKYIQKTLNDDELNYDIIICESDVIWSSGYFDKAFFFKLDSMKKMRKIAYAPSMADCKLSEGQEKKLFKYLKDIDYISVRESYEKEYLQKFTSKEIEHVLDPVFLLSGQEYIYITSQRLVKEKYLLLYLPADNNPKLRAHAYRFAKNNDLRIIEISSKLHISMKHKVFLAAGIEEFLSLIKYADVVFTNSFHAVCFSIIFRREFYAFSRMCEGKVGDICSRLGLADRYFSNDEIIIQNKINYDKIMPILEREISNSKNWINSALGIDVPVSPQP